VNPVIYMLVAFVAIGLFSERLKRWTYPLIGLVILVYIFHAYNHV